MVSVSKKKKCPLNPLTPPPSLWVLTPEVIAPPKKENREKKKSDPGRVSGLQLASETGLTGAFQGSPESQDGPADVGAWKRSGQPLQDTPPVHLSSQGP